MKALFQMSNNGGFGGVVEGNQVPESGPFRADIAGLTHQYKEVYQSCLQKIDSCSDDNVKVSACVQLSRI